MGDCSFKKIGSRLKISVENGNELIIFNVAAIHGGFEITSFVPISDHAVTVYNADTFLLPFFDLLFDQKLGGRIVGIVENLDQNFGFRPV